MAIYRLTPDGSVHIRLAYMGGVLAAICAASAVAEDDLGPISELAETGSWAEYQMELERTRDGKVARRDATLTIASIGEETVSGKKAQWIAVTVRIDAAEQLRSIILLPVDSLRGEGSPLTHAIRAFSQRGDEPPREIANPQQQARRGPLETLLPGKLTHVEALDEKRVKTAVGEIVAKGRTGRAKLVDRRGADELLYRIWSNPKVPFGLVAAEIEEVSPDRRSDRETTLTLRNFGTGAIPTSLEELDRLPIGLEVVHTPNPARATETGKSERRSKYTWWFKTSVTATASDVRIVEFGGYVWHEGKWVFSSFTGRPFSSKDFADWYSCPDALVKHGETYTDPTNWVSAPELAPGKTRWYFIGTDGEGRRVKGEAIIEQQGEIDPKGRKTSNRPRIEAEPAERPR